MERSESHGAQGAGPEVARQLAATVDHPAKLLRIASMIRELLGEARRTDLDEGGRTTLQERHGS